MSSSTDCVSTVMKSTGCGSASTTNTNWPVASSLAATSVLAICRESTSRSALSATAPWSTRMVPIGPRPPLLLGEGGRELLVVDQRRA